MAASICALFKGVRAGSFEGVLEAGTGTGGWAEELVEVAGVNGAFIFEVGAAGVGGGFRWMEPGDGVLFDWPVVDFRNDW